MFLTREDKNKLHNIRQCLGQQQKPTPKIIYWVLDLIHELEFKFNNTSRLLNIQIKENEELRAKLAQAKSTVIEKIEEAFTL